MASSDDRKPDDDGPIDARDLPPWGHKPRSVENTTIMKNARQLMARASQKRCRMCGTSISMKKLDRLATFLIAPHVIEEREERLGQVNRQTTKDKKLCTVREKSYY